VPQQVRSERNLRTGIGILPGRLGLRCPLPVLSLTQDAGAFETLTGFHFAALASFSASPLAR
jgi:hypothetical protein